MRGSGRLPRDRRRGEPWPRSERAIQAFHFDCRAQSNPRHPRALAWRDIPSWVATHWSRHKWECFIRTQRSDRTGVPRGKLPQDAPVTFTGEANAQNLIDTWRKRLCYQASPETRQYAEDFKAALHETEPELSDVLVPNCVYRGGCPELETCGYWYWLDLLSEAPIADRYAQYNELFYIRREEQGT